MPLLDAQRSISRWVRAPEGVAKALADEDASATGVEPGAARHRLEDLIRSDDALDATGRLEIYANAYFTRILGVLRSDYPALAALLGDATFNDLVTSYLLVEPSRSTSLRFAGLRLADFLANHAAAAGIRARCPVAADLAALEWARIDVFDAPDATVLSRETIETRAPSEFGELILCLGPWVRLRAFEYPVDRVWKAAIGNRSIPRVERVDDVHLLIWRCDEKVLHRRLEDFELGALAHMSLGTRFDQLCDWIATEIGEEEAPTRAATWLAQWLADGLLIESDGSERADA